MFFEVNFSILSRFIVVIDCVLVLPLYFPLDLFVLVLPLAQLDRPLQIVFLAHLVQLGFDLFVGWLGLSPV